MEMSVNGINCDCLNYICLLYTSPGAGILLFAKGAPFAQFTKMSTKDGWAMLLWVHSAFRTFGVSCKSAPPSTVAQLNGVCLLHAPQHSANGYRAR